jgi:chromosome segregation ATPase
MKKLLIIGIIGAVALFVVMKKTNVCSYAGTLFSQVSAEAKNSVPTKFELDRIRHEIAALDGDISQMVRPIAEYKVAIEKMRKDIDRNQAKIAEQKKTLLAVVEDLKGNPNELPFGGKMWKADKVRHQLSRSTESLKQREKQLKAQQQVLEAKEQALAATQDQLAKVIAKKREYEVRLAELEAEEETLAVARIGTEFKFDNSRATHIEESLATAEQRIRVTQHELEMRTRELANIPLNDRTGPADIQSIRNYLEGNEPSDKTVANK